jgi:hypothetical protein
MVVPADSVALLMPTSQEQPRCWTADQAFARVQPLLPANSRRGKPWRDHRQVLGGILWKLYTARPWRDVPIRGRRIPSPVAQVVILAVIPPGPTAANQTTLNGMPSQPDLPRTNWTGLSGRLAVIS